MKKFGFLLYKVDNWPPFSVEHLWLDAKGDNFLVMSYPFFVKEMSFGDEISISLDKNENVYQWQLASSSGNSTIWMISENENAINKFEELGCGVEGEPIKGYFSINVAPSVDKQKLSRCLQEMEEMPDVQLAFPCWRFDF